MELVPCVDDKSRISEKKGVEIDGMSQGGAPLYPRLSPSASAGMKPFGTTNRIGPQFYSISLMHCGQDYPVVLRRTFAVTAPTGLGMIE